MVMKYLDPKADLTFKKIFGNHPNRLRNLLNALQSLNEDELIQQEQYLPTTEELEISGFTDAELWAYDKFFLRSNLDFKINEWLRMGVNMSGYRTETDRPSSDVSAGNSGSSTSVFWQATLAKPIYPLKYESGLYSSATTLKGNMNPVASLTESGFNRNRNMLFNSSIFVMDSVNDFACHVNIMTICTCKHKS